MDAIVLLKQDHKTIEGLFKKYEKAGPRAVQAKRRLVGQIVKELTAHAYLEEEFFYPRAREVVPETAEHVLEAYEEHHLIELSLSELEEFDPSDETHDAKVRVLIENVRHHVEEEEKDWFPQLRSAMGRVLLGELGERLELAKTGAPSSPKVLLKARR